MADPNYGLTPTETTDSQYATTPDRSWMLATKCSKQNAKLTVRW
jgi:hypothetical protein